VPIQPLDVIWITDETAFEVKPRMVACIHVANGLFFRINSKPRQYAVPLLRVPSHMFLKWDSFLECGEPLELDEYIVDSAISDNGIVGSIHTDRISDILDAVDRAATISPADKAQIHAALEGLLPPPPSSPGMVP
jgi:hypothetical protein